MPIEHTTRAITENKFMMQLFADKESLKADIAAMEKSKTSNPSDERVSDYNINQKKYELSQIENRIKGKDYASVKSQCEQYFTDNATLFDKIRIVAETKDMIREGKLVNEWPHLAAVFLLDHASVTDKAKQDLAAVKPPSTGDIGAVPPKESLSPGEEVIVPNNPPKPQPTSPKDKEPNSPNTNQSPQPTLPKAVPEILTVQQKILFKDGAYYLTGPKGNTRRVEVSELLVNLNLPQNAPENLQKSVSLVQDFALLLDAYLLKNPNQKGQYNTTLKGIEKDFASPDIQSGRSVLDIKKWTYTLFSNNNFLGDSDLYTINQAIDIKDQKTRKLAILNFIRDRLGQSDLVLGKILEQNPSYFAFPSDENILANGDLSAAGLSVSGRQKVADTIRKAQQEAASNWVKNHKEYIAQFQAQHPGVQIDEEAARKMNEKLTVLALAKREIMYQKLYNKDVTGELALAQSIMGAKTLGISDKSWDISKEIGGMIAMEAIAIAAGVVTAGAATVAINAAMLGRNAYRGAKALEAYNAASKTKKVLTTSARILGSGAGFEAGAATTRSLIENGDFTSMHSVEGYTQSIAMMGVMSGIGKLITAGKLGKGLQFKEGAGMAKNIVPFVGQTVIEGSAIFGTSATIGSVVFDRRDNWTFEQMAQAMLMAALFKGAGRLTASKNPKGETEVKQTTTESSAAQSKKDVVPEGTFKSDSKVDLASFTTREITATDVRRAKVLINNGEYPQFIAQDGTIWSIRSVTGRSGKEVVEIGPLGQPSLDRRATIQEFVEGVNANVRKFKVNPPKATETPIPTAPESPVQKATEEPVQAKVPEATIQNKETVIAAASTPKSATNAIESVASSTKKMGESFSAEWLEKMAHKLGKPVKWLADQSVGPVFRMVTGNNPGALLSLVNPMGGWGGKVSTYGKNFVEHWKHPIHNVVGIGLTGERALKSPFLGMIAKNVVVAGGLTALDYFAVPNEDANKIENMAQNYYEMILLGWLGVVIMERGPIIEGAKDVKDWVSDRMQAKPF